MYCEGERERKRERVRVVRRQRYTKYEKNRKKVSQKSRSSTLVQLCNTPRQSDSLLEEKRDEERERK